MDFHPDFTLRRPTMDDAQAVTDLSNASDIADVGEPMTDIGMVYDTWNASYFNLEEDGWVAHDKNGVLATYFECYYEPGEEEVLLFWWVHPDYGAAGLESWILKLGEQHAITLAQRAAEPKPHEVLTAFHAGDVRATALCEAQQYRLVRVFQRMQRFMDSAPEPVPDIPSIRIRPYQPEQDAYGIYDALEESFEDHWRHARASYESWQEDKVQSDAYNPDLWIVAEDTETGAVVGGAVCTYAAGAPWIRMLGVRRAYRQRGIGRAVLLAAFNNFYKRGDTRVGLGVDSSSPTGAVKLYQDAGMVISEQRMVYAKPLNELTPAS